MVREAIQTAVQPPVRLNHLLRWLDVARSSWYGGKAEKPARPGRKPKAIDAQLAAAIGSARAPDDLLEEHPVASPMSNVC